MRKEIYEYIQSDIKLKEFIRTQPYWYRKLTRNPNDLETLKLASLHYYKQTIPDKVEKLSNSVEFASMMIQMFQAMRANN